MACCGMYELARSDSDAGESCEVGVGVDVDVVTGPERMRVPFMPLWNKD